MEEKKKLKFTALDLIIILFIVACIVGAVIKSGVIEKLTIEDKFTTIVYTVKFEDAQGYFTKEAFKVDTVVYDEASGTELGTVKEIKMGKAYGEVADKDGSLVKYEKPGDTMAYVTIVGSGLVDEYGYYVAGSTVVCPNADLQLETWLGTVSAKVVNVTVLGNN